MLSNCVTSSH